MLILFTRSLSFSSVLRYRIETRIELILPVTVMLMCSNGSFGIIGGQPAPNYPFFVVVHMADHICGGTLVKLDAVLTAAHCLYFDNEHRWASPLEIYVLHGDFSRPNNWKARYYSCENIFVHYKYDVHDSRRPFDVAVIKLEDEVGVPISTEPAILPRCRHGTRNWAAIVSGLTIGLGLTSVNPAVRSDRLRTITMTKIDCKCNNFLHQQSFPFQKCYRFPRGSSLADGDLGGTVVAHSNGTAVCLLGSSASSNYYIDGYFTIIFTPVDKFRCWMNRIFKENFTDVSQSAYA